MSTPRPIDPHAVIADAAMRKLADLNTLVADLSADLGQGVKLSALVADEGKNVVVRFTGSPTGEASMTAYTWNRLGWLVEVSDEARIRAHWRGYVDTARERVSRVSGVVQVAPVRAVS